MNEYIVQTRFATSSLINLINSEEIALGEIENHLAGLERQHKFLHDDFMWKDFDPFDDFDDAKMMQAFAKQASFRQNQIMPILEERDRTKLSIAAKKDSVKALAGALLQIAKQGISTVHGGLDNCPDGRKIRNEPIKNIIWQGRNQSLHYEEGNPHLRVRECFERVGIELKQDNLAKEVIGLLNWKTYEQYEDDLASLLG